MEVVGRGWGIVNQRLTLRLWTLTGREYFYDSDHAPLGGISEIKTPTAEVQTPASIGWLTPSQAAFPSLSCSSAHRCLPACQSSSIVKCLGEPLLHSFIALSHCFQVPFSTLLLLSHSHIVPSPLPCCDICCCLRGTPPGSEPKRHSVLVATSLVLRTPLDYSGTSVYRPIGVLVCEPPKGQVAPMSNMAPFYLWLLYLLHWERDEQ